MTKILRIDYAPYVLHATQGPNAKNQKLEKNGILLRFLFKDIGFGYADCHPLEEFGDASLQTQIGLLRQKEFSNITQRSFYFAKIDAEYRNKQKSVFDDIIAQKKDFPKNHYTTPALVRREDILAHKEKGFTKFKFKFGKHLSHEINYLNDNGNFFSDHQIKIRIDYNGVLTHSNIERWLPLSKRGMTESARFMQEKYSDMSLFEALKEYSAIIDFIEDPFSKFDKYHIDLCLKYSNYFKFSEDFVHLTAGSQNQDLNACFTYRVIKPARENIHKLNISKNKKIIFTSSMDHPLGQICALFDAVNCATTEHCGLLTHYGFEKNSYSEQLAVENTVLFPVEGFGFGFDSLLKAEKWERCF